MAITFFVDLILFSASAFIISIDTFSDLVWIYILVIAVILNYFMFNIMYPLSYINEQSRKQIAMLIQFKELITRLVRDKRMLTSHPLRISHRIQQLAVKMYRRDTQDLKGEERDEKMQELAEKTQETLQDAVD